MNITGVTLIDLPVLRRRDESRESPPGKVGLTESNILLLFVIETAESRCSFSTRRQLAEEDFRYDGVLQSAGEALENGHNRAVIRFGACDGLINEWVFNL